MQTVSIITDSDDGSIQTPLFNFVHEQSLDVGAWMIENGNFSALPLRHFVAQPKTPPCDAW